MDPDAAVAKFGSKFLRLSACSAIAASVTSALRPLAAAWQT